MKETSEEDFGLEDRVFEFGIRKDANRDRQRGRAGSLRFGS